jgi:(p)ppGpp synthase/HD superfamily hydrolase
MSEHTISCPYGDRYREALAWASILHAHQVRKGTAVPYLAHLLAVSALVWEDGGTEDDAIAALLHDAVEDQGGAPLLVEIRARFGDGVARVVAASSDTDVEPKPPWRQRKEAHLASLALADAATLRVMAADKLHNARTVAMEVTTHGSGVWERFRGGRDGSIWYYQAMCDLLERRLPDSVLVPELRRTVDHLMRLGSAPTGTGG